MINYPIGIQTFNKIRQGGYLYIDKTSKASSDMLGNISTFNINPTALFYQTGYLTIKEYERSSRLFRLGYPNKEVESSLMNSILNAYTHRADSMVVMAELREYLENGRTE